MWILNAVCDAIAYLGARGRWRSRGRVRFVLATGDGDLDFAILKRPLCPRCGPGPSGGLPIDLGGYWICIDCAGVGRIGDDGIVRVPTEAELFTIMTSPEWDRIEQIERVIERRIEERGAYETR